MRIIGGVKHAILSHMLQNRRQHGLLGLSGNVKVLALNIFAWPAPYLRNLRGQFLIVLVHALHPKRQPPGPSFKKGEF
jgi:hypothetical protein